MAKDQRAVNEELLKRVTSKAGSQLPQIPPPAGGLIGGSGSPPLPPGKLVTVRNASSLSPNERAVLENIGWDDSMPIPKNMADIVAEVLEARQAQDNAVLLPQQGQPAVVPAAPSLADKEALRARLTQEAQAADLSLIDQSEAAAMQQAPPSVRDAYNALQRPKVDPAVEVDVAQPAATQAAPQAAPQTTKPLSTEQPSAGADAHPVVCPHCKWDLAIPDVPEPSYGTKMAFLHTILGQQCFTHPTELFGGSVVVIFRTLTIREIEVAYQQAYRDRETGRAQTELDFWERVNRYRLFMQLKSIRTTVVAKGFIHELPDGLSKDTSGDAVKLWETEVPSAELGETLLQGIEQYITTKVLKTEALFRVVNSACNQFNRTVSKLEAMVDNSDFWKPTGERS